MGKIRYTHPARRTGWGGENQLYGPSLAGAGFVRFIAVFAFAGLIGGCGKMLFTDEEVAPGLEPTSVITYVPERPGYTWGPGDTEWQQVDELDWDATVPSSYPTPLPTDVLILPEA